MGKLIKPQALGESRLAEIGKIKIGGLGEKRTSAGGKEFRLPVKFDHFRVTRRSRTSEGNYAIDREVHAALGEKPTELDIRLPFEKTEDNLHTEFVRYSGQTKVWSCDGETATNCNTGSQGPCQRDTAKGCKCKPYSRLSVILEAAPTFGGVYTFRSTGIETCANLQQTLLMFEESFETLAGLPLRLIFYQSEDRLEDGGTSTSGKVTVVLRHDFAEAAERALEYRTRYQLVQKKLQMLSAGTSQALDEVDLEEEPEIAEEFFPDENDIASANTQDATDAIKTKLGIGPPPEVNVVEAEIIEEDDEAPGLPPEEDPEPEPVQVVEDEDDTNPVWFELDEAREFALERGLLGDFEVNELDEVIEKEDEDAAAQWVLYLREKLEEGR